MKEDDEFIASAAFSVMEAHVAKFREAVLDSELLLRFHGDNAD